MTCVFCHTSAQGNYSVHRDGFGVGPEAPLCDACGSGSGPSLMEIWAEIAQPSDEEFAFVQLKEFAAQEIREWFAR